MGQMLNVRLVSEWATNSHQRINVLRTKENEKIWAKIEVVFKWFGLGQAQPHYIPPLLLGEAIVINRPIRSSSLRIIVGFEDLVGFYREN